MATELTPPTAGRNRISSIDLMRGIVMVIMALDHVRDFFHVSAFTFDPEDPTQTTPALFFTRWITHFCAPTFVLLSGTSIRLSLQRKSKKELSRFLWTRGLWLILLEFTFVRFGIFFNLYYDATVVQVIYTIGASMLVMAALIHLKATWIFAIGLIITLGHNLLDGIRLAPENPLFTPWAFIYQSDLVMIAPGKGLLIKYPVLPWLGIMLLGYSMGRWYSKEFDPLKRRKLLLWTGLGALLLFVLLRFPNIYGDPVPWQTQKDAIHSFLSFLNCNKYPVSLLYTLMTLGPVLIILSFAEHIQSSVTKPFVIIGRVPMLYYLLHFYTIHLLAILTFLIMRHKSWSDLNFYFFKDGFTGYFGGLPIGWGFGLPGVYLVWITAVLICYPLCVLYNRYKSTHSSWWLSYL